MVRLHSWAVAAFVLCVALVQQVAAQTDPLPSWNDGPSKKTIIEFVARVTKEGAPEFVAPAERIAVFDNDGTLWSEQPFYFQGLFVFDRVRALAPKHPEWKERQPFKAVLENDMFTVALSGSKGITEIMAATHAGMTTDEFEQIVKDWLASATHPRFKRPYTDLVYQPMLEVLAFFRSHGFKTYIVSGGGIEFMRPWVEKVYGIPPEQVVASSIKMKYEIRDGRPVLMRLPEIEVINNDVEKPVAIQKFIGRRPIAAFGNSDGDFQMLEWTTAGSGPRLAVYIHHDDAQREWAYDRKSLAGKLARGLDEAPKRGWTVVSMKDEFKVVFPFEKPAEK